MTITVTRHAMLKAISRGHYADLNGSQLEQRISDEVHDAIKAGRVSNHKPTWALLVTWHELRGRKLRPLECNPGQQFAWDATEQHGWIIATHADTTTVITSLHRVRATTTEAAA